MILHLEMSNASQKFDMMKYPEMKVSDINYNEIQNFI